MLLGILHRWNQNGGNSAPSFSLLPKNQDQYGDDLRRSFGASTLEKPTDGISPSAYLPDVLFLLMHGKDTTIPKGAEVTAYVNGDLKLNPAKFIPAAESNGTTSPDASTSNPLTATPSPSTPQVGSIELHSNPDSAEVYADGSFIGNAPATLKLSPGHLTIRVALVGYREWTRDLTVQAGSEAHLTANLEKLE